MTAELTNDRSVLRVSGDDRESFLQGLVTNDVGGLARGLVYTALLAAQGKYLADFFLVPAEDAILIDVDTSLAASLLQRLTLYRLRAKVDVAPLEISVHRGLGMAPEGGFPDPRHPALGWRCYGKDLRSEGATDWNALRVEHVVPETGSELIVDDSYILEFGFDRLNGVDFRKGCFVGQEIVARMKHKTTLRKALVRVGIDGEAPLGTPITSGGKEAGRLCTQSGEAALAYLRLDRAKGDMVAENARLWRLDQQEIAD